MTHPSSSPSAIMFAIAAAVASTAAPAAGAPPGISVSQSADPAITVGEVTVNAAPDVVFAAVGDYNRWPAIFPDIAKVVVTAHDGDDARVTMIGHDDHHDNLHFHNQPAARMIWFEDTGGRATVWLEMVVVPGAVSGTTVVHSRLFADVHGAAALIVSDSRVRSMREDKLSHDLSALRRYFQAPTTVSQN